ncbi:MAG TPA: hypothetical protein VF605_13355 [Allosphingosinicella sp.]
MTGKIALTMALAATVGWAPAAAQREVASNDPYVHGPARAVFPVEVGEFRRSKLFQYDREGKNVSASYNLATPTGRLLITVYIYPAAAAAPAARPLMCGEEFASANAAISSQHGNAAPIERGVALPAEGVDPSLGHRSVYRFASPFDDRVQEIRSEAHLYCYVGGDWLVKYRVSAPAAVETRGPLEAFLREGPWPGRSAT